ncbi:potassium transporter 5-like [Macadamia integrifolia]|uniref:potassium transporter 5-like n=1 Tax=Macadamia integrifolia TaxID=60698 RepID=UPI001C4F12EB|nr:potassium transporter 5-like [Macadamia integrifolia]
MLQLECELNVKKMLKTMEKEMEVHNQKQNQTKLVRLDSLDQETSHISGMATKTTKALSIAAVMKLAIQRIGVVYGDIGTSP